MKMQPVESSQIAEVGHDGTTLAVRFKGSGALYHYDGVGAEDFAKMMDAESPATWWRTNIKANPRDYPYKRIEEDRDEAARDTAEQQADQEAQRR